MGPRYEDYHLKYVINICPKYIQKCTKHCMCIFIIRESSRM